MIRIKNLVDEVFQDYKKPSMLVGMADCDWKCARDGNFDVSVCQNSTLAQANTIFVYPQMICERYVSNPITKALIIGGLEPFLQFEDVISIIDCLRNEYDCQDDVVIYTGYNLLEIEEMISQLKKYPNIIVKFGRFQMDARHSFDQTLGIELASDNQYAIRIS